MSVLDPALAWDVRFIYLFMEAQGVLGVPSGVRLGQEDLDTWWVAGPIGTAFRRALMLSERADIER